MDKRIVELTDGLPHFTGSETWFQHSLVRKIRYTEGVKFVAETAGAYWLIDEIAIRQRIPAVKAEEFQVWTLAVLTGAKTAVLSCDDGNGNIVHSFSIPFTDFPLPEIKFYFADNCILLPSEN